MFIVILTDGELGAISRETVYYMRRPLRIIYLLMAGRKPIFSKTVIFDRETVNPGYSTSLFYISILLPYIYCLISIIYYQSLLSIIYCLLSIIYCLYINYLLSII